MKKRWFAWFLAAVMLCALLPASALASVACTFEFTTETLADGLVGAPYNDKIEWKSEHYDGSGSCDVVLMLDENTPLPDGLSLSEDGTISGVPAKAGEFTFVVNACLKDGTEDPTFNGAEKEYTITVYDVVSVVIPFEKIVREGGNTAPGAATFRFELYDFKGSNVSVYRGQEEEIQEEEINVWISKAPGENESFDAMTFTNVYTYNEYYQPTPTPEPDLPQTGDSGSFAFMAALALFAAAACTVRLCTKKH